MSLEFLVQSGRLIDPVPFNYASFTGLFPSEQAIIKGLPQFKEGKHLLNPSPLLHLTEDGSIYWALNQTKLNMYKKFFEGYLADRNLPRALNSLHSLIEYAGSFGLHTELVEAAVFVQKNDYVLGDDPAYHFTINNLLSLKFFDDAALIQRKILALLDTVKSGRLRVWRNKRSPNLRQTEAEFMEALDGSLIFYQRAQDILAKQDAGDTARYLKGL